MKPIFFFVHLVALLLLAQGTTLFAQKGVDLKAMALLEKAMEPLDEKKGFAIRFEGVAYALSNPLEIFTLPSYRVYRGGYVYVLGDKFEIKLGITNGLSDGNILFMTDEENKAMIVDSVHHGVEKEKDFQPSLLSMANKELTEERLSYEGEETVQGELSHKVKSGIKIKGQEAHTFYWISKKTGKLIMMAEGTNNQYTTYWLQKISSLPAGHSFKFNFPPQEIHTLKGYKVIDFRFVSTTKK